MVICLEQGADLHMVQLMPLTLTVSCRAVKHVCVCVCVRVCVDLFNVSMLIDAT